MNLQRKAQGPFHVREDSKQRLRKNNAFKTVQNRSNATTQEPRSAIVRRTTRSALRLSCARAHETLDARAATHVCPPDTATIPRASTYPPPPPPRFPPPRAAYTGRNRNRRSGPGPAAANAGGALISENNRTRTRTRARALFAPPPAPLTPDRPPAPPPPYSNGVWCSLPGGVTSAADQWRDAELAYNVVRTCLQRPAPEEATGLILLDESTACYTTLAFV